MSGVDWSPDGMLLSIGRITSVGASNYSYSITIVNPDIGQELYLDEYNPEMYENRTWIEQEDGYLFGRYRFQEDLSASEPLADILIDATRNGDRLLVSSGDYSALEIGCQDMNANTTYPLLNVTQSDTPGAAMPGLGGEFSLDGAWVWVSDFVGEGTDHWLAHCDSSAPIAFPENDEASDPYFSPDSSWLVMDQTNVVGENLSKISVMDLKSGQTKEVQAGLNTHSTWFQMPAAPIVPTSPSKEPAATLPARSAVATNEQENGSIDLQHDNSKGNRQLTMLAILLWAGALIAIVILMLYLWRQSSAVPKQVKEKAPETPVEEKPSPTPSHEEIEIAFRVGVELVHAGKTGEGIAELTKVITAEPENNIAWFWLGIASARQKEYRTAERCFLQAKRLGHPEAQKALEWLKTQNR
jgi:hypothetical protein